MKKTFSSYRHPLHDEIARRLADGGKVRHIAEDLNVTRRAVSRVRNILGLPKQTRATTAAYKLAKSSVERPGGHTIWTGKLASSGAPVIEHLGARLTASHVAFELGRRRKPVGVVTAVCGVHDCLTGLHLDDEIDRRRVRMSERAVRGLRPQPWDTCNQGLHDWDSSGRLGRNLKPYCKTCNSDRMAAVRTARKEEGTA